MNQYSVFDLPSFTVQATLQEDGSIWLRADFDEVGPKEQWDVLCDFRQEIRDLLGVEVTDTYVEHDCITARIIRP